VLRFDIISFIKKYWTSGDKKIRSRIYVFLACLSISVFLWLMIKLSLESSSDIDLPVAYNNLPENKMLINKPDSILYLRIRSKGFKLFSDKYFKDFNTFSLDLRNLKLKSRNAKYYAFIQTSYLKKKIRRELNIAAELLSVSPDTLFFEFLDVVHKKVPVKLDFDYSFKKQYFLYDTIQIEPDSVIITGPLELLNTISFVETLKTNLNEISEDQTFSLDINTENIDQNISLSKDNVEVYLDVEEFTEAEVEVPIETIKDVMEITLRTFPDKVKITYLVALKDYKRVEPAMFSAYVNYKSSSGNKSSKLKVHIKQNPKFTKITKIQPEKVEFIIHK